MSEPGAECPRDRVLALVYQRLGNRPVAVLIEMLNNSCHGLLGVDPEDFPVLLVEPLKISAEMRERTDWRRFLAQQVWVDSKHSYRHLIRMFSFKGS